MTHTPELPTNVRAYVEAYQMDLTDEGGGIYTPTENEKALIEDAIHGYIAEVGVGNPEYVARCAAAGLNAAHWKGVSMDKLTRQLQAFRPAPKDGVQGDCYRTAVACVLGVDRDSVPHSHDDLNGGEAMAFIDAWLKPQGLLRIAMPVLADTLDEVARNIYPHGGGLPVIVTGRGPRDVNHCVVVYGPDDIWCPTLGSVPSEVALLGGALPDRYFWAEWIVADPRRALQQAEGSEAP